MAAVIPVAGVIGDDARTADAETRFTGSYSQYA
jgi:hypothetical protein